MTPKRSSITRLRSTRRHLFGGSGSTLIAAHKTGRRAYICELDPIYCDRILRRWELFAKDEAERIACGLDGQTLIQEAV